MQVWVHAYLDFSSGRLSFTQIHTVKYLIVSDDRAWSGGLRQDQMRVWVAVIGNGSIQRAWFGLANSRPIRRIETGFLSEYALCDSKGTSIESHQNQRNQRQMHGSERDGSKIHNTQWTMGSVDMGPSGCSDQWSIVSPMQSHFCVDCCDFPPFYTMEHFFSTRDTPEYLKSDVLYKGTKARHRYLEQVLCGGQATVDMEEFFQQQCRNRSGSKTIDNSNFTN